VRISFAGNDRNVDHGCMATTEIPAAASASVVVALSSFRVQDETVSVNAARAGVQGSGRYRAGAGAR